MQEIIEYLTGVGIEVDRFWWDPTYNSSRAVRDTLKNESHSFFRIMAARLNTYLETLANEHGFNRDWIVVAHSAGGGIWYRWLADYAPAFREKHKKLPECVFVIASPYNWDDELMKSKGQMINFESGAQWIIKSEWKIEAHNIISVSSGKLVVILAKNDITTPLDMTGFDKLYIDNEDVYQEELPDVGHSTVCCHSRTIELIKVRLWTLDSNPTSPADTQVN